MTLRGKQFGEWKVLGLDKNNTRNGVAWLCKCSCGTVRSVINKGLLYETSKSCGCKNKLNLDEIINKKYNKLTVISFIERKDEKIFVKCLCDCGNEMITKTNKLLTNHTKSCGCHRIETNKSRIKEKNGNWNCNLTKHDRENKRLLGKYKIFRDEVYKRDNFTCRICGAKGKLNAHHLLSYNKYAIFRTDVDNGITLCKNCHTEFHNIYGKKNFTLFDFCIFSSLKISSQDWLNWGLSRLY